MDWSHLQPGLSHTDNDKRIQALGHLRDELQQTAELVDPDSLATLLRTSLKSNNAYVSNAALSCLPHFFPRIVHEASDSPSPSQRAHTLKHAFSLLLPLDKLGDAKAATRELARDAVISAARTSLRLGVTAGTTGKDKDGPWQVLEKGMQDHAFKSKNAKAREQSLHYLAGIRCPPPEYAIPLPSLKPYTPLLLPLLSDSDSTVRSLALHTTISVFGHPTVTAPAKADLKKAMAKLDVAKKVQDQILSAVLGGGSSASMLERSPSQASLSSAGGKSESSRNGGSARSATSSHHPPLPAPAADGPARRTRSQQATTTSTTAHTPSLLASLPATAFPSDPSAVHAPSSGDLSPVYIASERDLRAEFDVMKPGFGGKETEHNWQVRDRSIATIRGMLLGGIANGELQAAFVKAVKEVADGIAKISSSLRTTLAMSALALIAEIASSLPPHQLDLFLDPFLSHCLSMAGQTKKIVASASQSTVSVFLERSTYHLRTLQLLVATLSEKTVSARQFASQHFVIFLRAHGSRSKAAIDSTGGADELEAAIKKALADQNAQVREGGRTAFWEFERGWAQRAEKIMAGLDANGRKLLEKARPAEEAAAGPAAAAPIAAKKALTGRPAATAAVAGGTKKPSVREMMMAARRRKQEAEANGGGQADGFLPEEPVSTPVKASPAASSLSSPASALRTSTSSAGTPSRIARASLSPPRSASTAKGGLLFPSIASSRPSPLAPPRPVDEDDTGSIEEEPTPETPSSPNNDLMHSPSPFRLRSPLPSASPAAASPQAAPSCPSPAPAMRHNPSQSSLASSATSADCTSSRSPRTGRTNIVPEPIVDDALREQAMQAEQAAQRLLELAEDEAEDGAVEVIEPRAATPKAQRVLPSGIVSAGGMQTPLTHPARTKIGAAAGKTFENSPDPRDGAGGGKGTWWMRQGDNLPPAPTLPADSPSRTAEISSLITSLQSLSIDAPSLRKLSALSKERPVREAPEDENLEDEPMTPSKNGTASNGSAGKTTAKWWVEERRFEKVYEGLRAFLLKEKVVVTGLARDIALLLLKDLVENQFPCFSGEEAGLFDLLFKLREDPSRTSIAATESIATLFAARLEPVYGLGALNPSLSAYLTSSLASPDAIARSYALGLKLVGSFFEGLPAEVLEDVLPGARDLLKRALNDTHSGDLRRAAITALVSAQSVLRDEQRLTELVGGLERDQANLLSYYCAKRGV
ncbi:hypothetical protein JCM11641_005880 [Rhodosporidiobolus odoratus]